MAKNMEISYLIDFYGEMLGDKQREIIDDYYNSDLSLAEIAEDKGMTRQGVRDHIKRTEQQLLSMEEKLGLHRRFLDLSNKIREIEELSKKIENSTDDGSIKNLASSIIKLTIEIDD